MKLGGKMKRAVVDITKKTDDVSPEEIMAVIANVIAEIVIEGNLCPDCATDWITRIVEVRMEQIDNGGHGKDTVH
jgi:hypothetical protein